ncbi:MAG: adaptor protein MecA [Firmicutes bacterium]|nr:adaptor protein MecA [Bacillota bacterium]
MKAERINQDQIRFTLSESDLIERNLQMAELSYGSDKTKALFDDMMRTAYEQFGIDFSEKPLMIEAIPLSERTLSITVTRVSGPAELGGLFGANFPLDSGKDRSGGAGSWNGFGAPSQPGADHGPAASYGNLKGRPEKESSPMDEIPGGAEGVIYLFDSFENLSRVCSRIPADLQLKNQLYVDEKKGVYYLAATFKKVDPQIRYVVSLLTQFADEWFWGRHAYLIVKEHARLVIRSRALQKLGEIERLEEGK